MGRDLPFRLIEIDRPQMSVGHLVARADAARRCITDLHPWNTSSAATSADHRLVAGE